ncbi:MAG: phosphoglucosamine mutase [Chitinophagales bacterium]|nr:phosphoglucosamine mutase [Bacteroidota bacterium]MCB9042191.1 phosphoglucosamine mutase [Chitinophagales bacterium]
MSLITSISGIRGTIGGNPQENLTPPDLVRFASAYGQFLLEKNAPTVGTIVIGRDARPSGAMLFQLVSGTLNAMGFDIIDLGLSTTPTVEMAVKQHKAVGGIILTASHNPQQWNALKLLDHEGNFLNAQAGEQILALAEKAHFSYALVENLGKITTDNNALSQHIEAILQLDLVHVEAIRQANFTVAFDAVNSSGSFAVPQLLNALGVNRIHGIHNEANGWFPHNPEPLPQHLGDLCHLVQKTASDIGIAVDPDVDRLVLITEKGEPLGEENTLVCIADYILQHTPGACVSNLSSSRALADIAQKYHCQYHKAAVGEVNVVEKMKTVNAVIGGEGNGGVIYPPLHYGRDALVGIALLLSYLAERKISLSHLQAELPHYAIVKDKFEASAQLNLAEALQKIEQQYADYPLNTVDGLRIDFPDSWVHLRRSNTEPIIRIIAEAPKFDNAQNLVNSFKNKLQHLLS